MTYNKIPNKCIHGKNRTQTCSKCSRFKASILLNTKGKQLNNGYNGSEYAPLMTNEKSFETAITLLTNHIYKHKNDLLHYCNVIIIYDRKYDASHRIQVKQSDPIKNIARLKNIFHATK